jgi:hypothetical protein
MGIIICRFFYISKSYQQLKRFSLLVIGCRTSYIILGGRWCGIALNVHAPRENKVDDAKDSFYDEFELVFDSFVQCHITILLGDFNAKVGIQLQMY